MSNHDDHVHQTWKLIRDDGDEIRIDLLTDSETVQVEGGDGESFSAPNARRVIEGTLLPKYRAAGYREAGTYPVNDLAGTDDEEAQDEGDPHARPDQCPQCGAAVDYEPHFSHPDVSREGPAWLCTACKWGQFCVA